MKTRLASLIGVAVLALAATAPAFAQDKNKFDDEIVVVPYGVQTHTEGRTASGARIEVRALQRVVTTEGLNLRYDRDVTIMPAH